MTLLASREAISDVKIDADRGFIWISGEITDQDARDIETSYSILEIYSSSMAAIDLRAEPNVVLNSVGGDAIAAMRIGYIVRKLEGRTFAEGDCLSSCPLIFISGVVRDVYQETIGLHRPYLASGPANRHFLERTVPDMLGRIKRYISDMGVSDEFFQQMVNTDPSQIRIFRDDRIYTIIPKIDPLYDEIRFAYSARHLGTTSAEVRQRAKDSEACKEPQFQSDRDAYMKASADYSVCVQAIMWGLSKRLFEQRELKSAVCKLNKEDLTDIIAAAKHISHREILDHPIYLKREACIRDIMLDKVPSP